MCDEGLVRRRKEDKARIVSGGLQIAREEVIETESDEDNDDHDDLMRLNPCSVWPPVCGQVCISEPHQVKQTQIIVWKEIEFTFVDNFRIRVTSASVFKVTSLIHRYGL